MVAEKHDSPFSHVLFGILKMAGILLGLWLIVTLFISGLPGTDYRFESGSRVAIWGMAQLHIMFAALVLGVPMFAVVTEIIGIVTKDERYDALAHEFTKLLMLAFTITALLGAGLFLGLVTFYPKFYVYMTRIFKPTYYLYAALLFAEVIYVYLYYYSWNALKQHKALHVSIGVMLNVAGTAIMLVGNAWATFMMSPGGMNPIGQMTSLWDAVNNLTWMPLNIHRFIGNVAFGGFIVGAYAAVKFLNSKTQEERAHYDWMGYTGNFIGVIGLIPMPFAGYWLAREVYEFDKTMGISMMGGLFSWLFIIQAVLIGLLFIGVNYYFWIGMGRIQGGERFAKYQLAMLGVLVVCFAVWMTPHTLIMTTREAAQIGGFHPIVGPLGVMSAKLTVVNLIILTTFLSFLLYRRANKLGPGASTALTHGVQWVVFAVASALILFYSMKGQMAPHPVSLTVPVLGVTLGAKGILAGLVVACLGLGALVKRQLTQGIIFVLATVGIVMMGIRGYQVPDEVRINFLSVYQVLIVLIVLVFVTVLDLLLFRGAQKAGEIRWGEMPARSQYTLILLAVTIVLLMGLMGYVRSGLRQEWHISAIVREGVILYPGLRDTHAGASTPSIAAATRIISAITLIFFSFVTFVFWLGERKGKVPSLRS